MASSDLLFQVKKSKEQIESLLEFSDLKIDPVLIELFTRLSFIENEISDVKNNALDNFTDVQVKTFLTKEILNIFTSFFSNNILKNVNFVLNESLNTQDLLKIIEILPNYLSIMPYFRFDNYPVLCIEKNLITLTGKLSVDQDLEEHREKIYIQIKKLLQQNALLTYKLSNIGNEISLVCHIDSKFQKYFLSCEGEDDVTLALPSVISHFETSEIPKHRHLCLEITDKFTLVKHQGVPENLTLKSESSDRVIFYFPFIFRPLSLIIPIRGKNLPFIGSSSNENTGCVENGLPSSKANKRMVNVDLFFYFER